MASTSCYSPRAYCALPGLFHLPNSFAKPPPWFSVCYSGHANCSWQYVFECSWCIFAVGWRIAQWMKKWRSCVLSELWASLRHTDGCAPCKMQSMLYLSVHSGDASVLHHSVPGMLYLQGMHFRTLSRFLASILSRLCGFVKASSRWSIQIFPSIWQDFPPGSTWLNF